MRIKDLRPTLILVAAVAVLGASCTTAPPLTPQEYVDQIAAFVEQARGHEFVTDPVVQFVDPTAFKVEVLANLAAEEADIAPDGTAFTALDWIDGSQDLITEFRRAYGGGVVGFYDPLTETLKVRGTSLTPYTREVIAHELTHALDDQIHDLSDLDGEGLLDDAYISKLIAIEGSAERIRSSYYNSMNTIEQFQSLQEQLNAGGDPDLFTVPITLLTLTTGPYLRGATFQQNLVTAFGNPAGPDLSLTRYPANTEQGFDTTKYLSDEPAAAVPAPPTDAGAAVVRSGDFGPYLLSLVLREGLVLDTLDPLTAGWAGGSYTSWESVSGADCIRVDTTWDSNADAVGISNALSGWGTLHVGAVVEMPSTTDVRLTRCD